MGDVGFLTIFELAANHNVSITVSYHNSFRGYMIRVKKDNCCIEQIIDGKHFKAYRENLVHILMMNMINELEENINRYRRLTGENAEG